ncbi:cobalt-precorrin-5B (C(1))-methyltransferase CbiD, partial [Citrobacter sp. VF227]
LPLLSWPLELLTLVSDCDTTEAAMEHIEAYGFQRIYDHLAKRSCMRVLQTLRFTKNPPTCDAIMFSFDNQVLGCNRPIADIAEGMQC